MNVAGEDTGDRVEREEAEAKKSKEWTDTHFAKRDDCFVFDEWS